MEQAHGEEDGTVLTMISNVMKGRPFLLDSFMVATSAFSAVCTLPRRTVRGPTGCVTRVSCGCEIDRDLEGTLKLGKVGLEAYLVVIPALDAKSSEHPIAIRARLHRAARSERTEAGGHHHREAEGGVQTKLTAASTAHT